VRVALRLRRLRLLLLPPSCCLGARATGSAAGEGGSAQKTARSPCGGVAVSWAQEPQRDRCGANSPIARREDAAVLKDDAGRHAGRRPDPLGR